MPTEGLVVATREFPVDASKGYWQLGMAGVRPGECVEVTASGLYTTNFNDTSGGSWCYPEGIYPPGGPLHPTYEPEGVLRFWQWPLAPTEYPAANVDYQTALVMLVLPAGSPAPPLLGNTTALRPTRHREFTAQEISQAGTGNGPWDLWFIVNTAYFPDNRGALNVKVARVAPGAFGMSNERFTVIQEPRLGLEATSAKGTYVNPDLRPVFHKLNPKATAEHKRRMVQGIKRLREGRAVKMMSQWTLSGEPDYVESGYFLSSLIAVPISDQEQAGVHGHYFVSLPNQKDTRRSFTAQLGSAEGCEQAEYLEVQSYGWKGDRDGLEISGSMIGRRLKDSSNDGVTLYPGNDEEQRVQVTATGGTFRLVHPTTGEASDPIPHGANAAQLQPALAAMASIGAGNVTCEDDGAGVKFKFVGALGKRNLGTFLADGSGLNSGATVQVTTVTQGGLRQVDEAPIYEDELVFKLADTLSGLDSEAAISGSFSSGWQVGERVKPFWKQDGTNTFSGLAEVEPKEMIDVLLPVGALSNALKLAWETKARKYAQFEAQSKDLRIAVTSVPFRFELTACVSVAEMKEFEDEDGVYAVGFSLEMVDDPPTGLSGPRAYLRNGKANYAA